MLPMPATNSWSIRRAFSPALWEASSTQNFSQLMTFSRGSKPRWASSGRAVWPSTGAAETKSSPKVRGSTKRSCPPWVNVMTAWVWGALGSLALFTRWSCPLIPRCTTSVCPSSRPSSRYLPARSMDLMVWPSSWARNCLALAWRRTVRPFRTSTDLIFLPTTSPWRSRRMVSTSGSSGIPSASLNLQRSAGRLGGHLLGVFLGSPLPCAEALASNVHRGQVPPGMVGAEALDLVVGNPTAEAHRLLLQAALVVGLAGLTYRGGDPVPEQREDQALRLGQTAVEVDRTDQRLGGVGQDGPLGPAPGLVLTPTQAEMLVDPQVEGHFGQYPGVDHRRPDLGHQAVGELRAGPVGVLGHHQAQYGVPQELEALVGRQTALLGAPRPMGEGLVQQSRVDEPVVDPAIQSAPTRRCPRGGRRRHRAPQAPPSLAWT